MKEVKKYPQMPGMTDEEIDDFLQRPGLLARLSTINPDGTPHTMPIWFEWRNGEILVSTQSLQRKVKNMQRDSRVTVLIDQSDMPYKGVMIYGIATLDFNDAVIKRVPIFERYIGSHDGAVAYAQQMAKKWEPVLARIKPTRMISFDYTKGSLVPLE